LGPTILICAALLVPATAFGAIPTPVNGQITDPVSQSNVKVLGEAPAVSMGNLYQATNYSLAMQADTVSGGSCHVLTSPPSSLTDCLTHIEQ
jgi:hypothetical protein